MVAGNTSTGMNRPQQGMMQAQPMQAQPMQAQPMQQSPRPPGAAFGQPATMLPGMSPGMGGKGGSQVGPTLGQPLNPLQQQQMMGLMQQRQLQMRPATPTGAPTQVNAQPGNMSIDEFARSPLMGPTTMEMRNPVEFEGSMRDPELVRRYEQYRSGAGQAALPPPGQRLAGQEYAAGLPGVTTEQALEAMRPQGVYYPEGYSPVRGEATRQMPTQFQPPAATTNNDSGTLQFGVLGMSPFTSSTPQQPLSPQMPGYMQQQAQLAAQQQRMQPSMARTPMTGGLGGFFGRPRVTFGNNVQSAGQGISGLMRFFR